MNLNNKILVIIDFDGLGGKLLVFWEFGVIFIYLVEKIGKFLFVDLVVKYEVI